MKTSDRSSMIVDPFTADVCSGSFQITDRALRRAFSDVSLERLELYGLRELAADGTTRDVGLIDPRRDSFEDMCRRFGQGEVELADFRRLISPGCGLVANSLQSPHAPDSGFNELAAAYVAHLGCRPNEFPEIVDVVLFMGCYERGFGMHRDTTDVTAFVLDGCKYIVVREDEVDRTWVVPRGRFLHWRSVHWHSNVNPQLEWSITINFSVGPDDLRKIPRGTAVEFCHPETKMKDYLAVSLSQQADGAPPHGY
jgi:hypothetical protein